MPKYHRLGDTYRFPGFRPGRTVRGLFGDPKARVLRLQRREKTRGGTCGHLQNGWYDRRVRRVRDRPCGDTRIYLELAVRRRACKGCGAVKLERLDWLADYPFYTQRFAYFVGRRCRAATIKDVAQETHLDWKTIKELEKQYLREQLRHVGLPGPKVMGIDEVSVAKGHPYRMVVSDWVRRRPLWFGGQDRSAASRDRFYAWLGDAEEPPDPAGRHGYVETL